MAAYTGYGEWAPPPVEDALLAETANAPSLARGPRLDPIGDAHRGLLAEARCRLQRACVPDRYARRIDRFFVWNPALANDYLVHSYFEVRAVAAKHADVFHLPPPLDDPDETVRPAVARDQGVQGMEGAPWA